MCVSGCSSVSHTGPTWRLVILWSVWAFQIKYSICSCGWKNFNKPISIKLMRRFIFLFCCQPPKTCIMCLEQKLFLWSISVLSYHVCVARSTVFNPPNVYLYSWIFDFCLIVGFWRANPAVKVSKDTAHCINAVKVSQMFSPGYTFLSFMLVFPRQEGQNEKRVAPAQCHG